MSDDVELGRITIVRTLDDDGSGVSVQISDDMNFYDAMAMMAIAQDTIEMMFRGCVCGDD